MTDGAEATAGRGRERWWMSFGASLLGIASAVCLFLAWSLDWDEVWIARLGFIVAPLLAVAATALGVVIRRPRTPGGQRGDPTPLIVGAIALLLCAGQVVAMIGLAANGS